MSQSDGEKKSPKSQNPFPPRHRITDLKEKIAGQKKKIKTKTNPPGGFDPTQLPDAPPGYTLKFIFHKAINLPAADIATVSSDPFIHATLRAPVPKRHREDPDLTHRTRTLRKCTNPVWDEEWIVANVPQGGFLLKCRIYDEDYPDNDDRLGNVTVRVPRIDEHWKGFPPPGQEFVVKKRAGSTTAYALKACASILSTQVKLTPSLFLSIQVLGRSEPPHAQMYTVGPTTWIKHFSPMIGRLTGTKVNRHEHHDVQSEKGASKVPQKHE
jgi:hypothetical protein